MAVNGLEMRRRLIASQPHLETVSGAMASFVGERFPLKLCKVQIEPVQAGSGEPSPDNVRPITGWTGAKVTRTGKNLLDPSIKTETNNNTYHILSVKPNTNYVFSTDIVQTGLYVLYETSPNTWANLATKYTTASIAFNSMGYGKIRLMTYSIYSQQKPLYFQLELGSTATAYEPYSGTTYSITFPSEAGTVYGGSLDVTNGVLTVDRVNMLFNGSQKIGLANWMPNEVSVGWLYRPEVTPGIWNEHQLNPVDLAEGYVLSDKLQTVVYGGSEGVYQGQTPRISLVGSSAWAVAMRMTDTSLTTATAVNAYLAQNPIQVVYKLVEPITYQLTPQEITTLIGANNIWADTGDVSVTYWKH